MHRLCLRRAASSPLTAIVEMALWLVFCFLALLADGATMIATSRTTDSGLRDRQSAAIRCFGTTTEDSIAVAEKAIPDVRDRLLRFSAATLDGSMNQTGRSPRHEWLGDGSFRSTITTLRVMRLSRITSVAKGSVPTAASSAVRGWVNATLALQSALSLDLPVNVLLPEIQRTAAAGSSGSTATVSSRRVLVTIGARYLSRETVAELQIHCLTSALVASDQSATTLLALLMSSTTAEGVLSTNKLLAALKRLSTQQLAHVLVGLGLGAPNDVSIVSDVASNVINTVWKRIEARLARCNLATLTSRLRLTTTTTDGGATTAFLPNPSDDLSTTASWRSTANYSAGSTSRCDAAITPLFTATVDPSQLIPLAEGMNHSYAAAPPQPVASSSTGNVIDAALTFNLAFPAAAMTQWLSGAECPPFLDVIVSVADVTIFAVTSARPLPLPLPPSAFFIAPASLPTSLPQGTVSTDGTTALQPFSLMIPRWAPVGSMAGFAYWASGGGRTTSAPSAPAADGSLRVLPVPDCGATALVNTVGATLANSQLARDRLVDLHANVDLGALAAFRRRWLTEAVVGGSAATPPSVTVETLVSEDITAAMSTSFPSGSEPSRRPFVFACVLDGVAAYAADDGRFTAADATSSPTTFGARRSLGVQCAADVTSWVLPTASILVDGRLLASGLRVLATLAEGFGDSTDAASPVTTQVSILLSDKGDGGKVYWNDTWNPPCAAVAATALSTSGASRRANRTTAADQSVLGDVTSPGERGWPHPTRACHAMRTCSMSPATWLPAPPSVGTSGGDAATASAAMTVSIVVTISGMSNISPLVSPVAESVPCNYVAIVAVELLPARRLGATGADPLAAPLVVAASTQARLFAVPTASAVVASQSASAASACPAGGGSGVDGLFRCRDSSMCVHFTKFCDGVQHCADGTDEAACEPFAAMDIGVTVPLDCPRTPTAVVTLPALNERLCAAFAVAVRAGMVDVANAAVVVASGKSAQLDAASEPFLRASSQSAALDSAQLAIEWLALDPTSLVCSVYIASMASRRSSAIGSCGTRFAATVTTTGKFPTLPVASSTQLILMASPTLVPRAAYCSAEWSCSGARAVPVRNDVLSPPSCTCPCDERLYAGSRCEYLAATFRHTIVGLVLNVPPGSFSQFYAALQRLNPAEQFVTEGAVVLSRSDGQSAIFMQFVPRRQSPAQYLELSNLTAIGQAEAVEFSANVAPGYPATLTNPGRLCWATGGTTMTCTFDFDLSSGDFEPHAMVTVDVTVPIEISQTSVQFLTAQGMPLQQGAVTPVLPTRSPAVVFDEVGNAGCSRGTVTYTVVPLALIRRALVSFALPTGPSSCTDVQFDARTLPRLKVFATRKAASLPVALPQAFVPLLKVPELVTACGLLLLGLTCLVVAVYQRYQARAERRRAAARMSSVHTISSSAPSTARSMATTSVDPAVVRQGSSPLSGWALRAIRDNSARHSEESSRFRFVKAHDHMAYLFGTLTALLLLAAGLAGLFYFFEIVPRDATTRVLVEVFLSPSCDGHPLSPRPVLAYVVPADGTCFQLTDMYAAIGSTAVSLVVAGTCAASTDGSEGNAVVALAAALTVDHCVSANGLARATTMKAAGMCFPLTDFPYVNGLPYQAEGPPNRYYLKVSCSTKSAAEGRVAALNRGGVIPGGAVVPALVSAVGPQSLSVSSALAAAAATASDRPRRRQSLLTSSPVAATSSGDPIGRLLWLEAGADDATLTFQQLPQGADMYRLVRGLAGRSVVATDEADGDAVAATGTLLHSPADISAAIARLDSLAVGDEGTLYRFDCVDPSGMRCAEYSTRPFRVAVTDVPSLTHAAVRAFLPRQLEAMTRLSLPAAATAATGALVAQSEATFMLPSVSADAPEHFAMAQRVPEVVDVAFLSTQRFFPLDEGVDRPMAWTPNGYGTAEQLSGYDATAGATCFPNVRGTKADLGAGPLPITAIWFMKATALSRGVVWAVTDDALLDASSGRSAVPGSVGAAAATTDPDGLGHDREGARLPRRPSSQEWRGVTDLYGRFQRPQLSQALRASDMLSTDGAFLNANAETTGVYFAVTVNGAARTLTALGVPGQGARPFAAVFNMNDMASARGGVATLFDGSWHHVALSVESKRLRLFIDGQLPGPAASACFTAPPVAVRDIRVFETDAPNDFVVGRNGTLCVGGFNGGIHGLSFESDSGRASELSQRGSLLTLREGNFPWLVFAGVGLFLSFTALSMLFAMIVGVARDFIETRDKELAADLNACKRQYLSVCGVKSETYRQMRLSSGDRFPILTLDAAIKISGLKPGLFFQVLEQIEKLAFNTDDAKCDLLAFLWTQAKKTFAPPERLEALFQEYRDVTDLSEDGLFLLPKPLWEQVVRVADGEDAFLETEEGAQAQAGVDDAGSPSDKGLKPIGGRRAGGAGRGGKPGAKAGGGGKSGGGGKAGSSGAKSSGGASSVSGSTIVQMFLPLANAMQAIQLYTLKWPFPNIFMQYLNTVLDVLAFDFEKFIPEFGFFTIVGTFILALLLSFTMIYFIASDFKSWLRHTAQYVLRRDAADRPKLYNAAVKEDKRRKQKGKGDKCGVGAGGEATQKGSKLLMDAPKSSRRGRLGGVSSRRGSKDASWAAGFVAEDTAAELHEVDEDGFERQPNTVLHEQLPLLRYVMTPRICVAVDQHIDGARRSNRVHVLPSDLTPAPCVPSGVDWLIHHDGGDTAVGVADHGDTRVPLQHVGIRCPMCHRFLNERTQTDITENPLECCIVTNGARCPRIAGTMLVCGRAFRDGTSCPYAICQDHTRTSLGQFLLVSIVTSFRALKAMGVSGVIAFVAISLNPVLYFPVMRTCMLFLACDPEIKCYTDRCWSNPDPWWLFLLVCVLTELTIVGALTPLVLFLSLWRRRSILEKVFFHRAYRRFYLATDSDLIDELRKAAAEDDDAEEEPLVGRLARFFAPALPQVTSRSLFSFMVSVPKLDVLSMPEWERFLAVDLSKMKTLYETLEFEWMNLTPFLLLQKVAVLAPLVYLAEESMTQFIVSASVEIAFGLFMFWSQPYVNPWVDTMYRAGSVHNIGLLGWAALHRVLLSRGDDEGLSLLMLLWTTCYMMFVAALFIATVIVPTLSVVVNQVIVGRQMARVGMRTVDLSSLFLNPMLHEDVFCTEAEADIFEQRHDITPPPSDDEEEAPLTVGIASQAETERNAELATLQQSQSFRERLSWQVSHVQQEKQRREAERHETIAVVEETRVQRFDV